MATKPFIVLTDAQKEEAINLRQDLGTMEEIADRLMISRASLYKILDREPKFAAAMAKAKAGFKLSLRRKLAKRCLNGSDNLLIHASKALLGNAETHKVSASVNVSELSDEELERQVKAILERASNGNDG